jgi:hypothetical protein
MALTVEDGTGIAGADSYVALAEARTLAASIGLALSNPANDATDENALRAGVHFLEGFADRFQGYRTNGLDQVLSWPRSLATIGGFEVEGDNIPHILKAAQVAAAAEFLAGKNLFPDSDGRFVTRKEIDVLVTEYSEKLTATEDGGPRFGVIDAYLRPLLIAKRASRLGAY